MSNLETLLAFNIWRRLRDDPRLRIVQLWNDRESIERAGTLERMIAALPGPVTLRREGGGLPPLADPPAGVVVAYLGATIAAAQEAEARNRLATIVTAALPPPGTLDAGLVQEVCHHDFSLGGFNEWSDEPDRFGAHMMQHLSTVHAKRCFPTWAREEIDFLAASTGGPLHALDIGCGPISRLRWGMIHLGMKVTGIDPLTEPYLMLLARHGLDRLEAIHPTRRIGGFAESFSWPNASCELVYSCNALDHTQDLPAAIRRIRDVLRPGGVAILTVYTREGSRQRFEGLHKYDIWLEGDTLMFSSSHEAPAPLLMRCEELRLRRVAYAGETSLSVILARD